jgi:hypothetical protein
MSAFSDITGGIEAEQLWSALANVKWYRGEELASYSFRSAGALIARLVKHGDYLDYYCCAEMAKVEPWIAERLGEYGSHLLKLELKVLFELELKVLQQDGKNGGE